MQFKVIDNQPIISFPIKTISWYVELDFLIDTGFTGTCALYRSKDNGKLIESIDFISELNDFKITIADNSEVDVLKTDTIITVNGVNHQLDTILIDSEESSIWILWIDFLRQIQTDILFWFKSDLFKLNF